MGCGKLTATEGSIVKLTCDMDANTAYLRLRERPEEIETIALASDFLGDIEKLGLVCGVELLNATEQLASGDHRRLIVEVAQRNLHNIL